MTTSIATINGDCLQVLFQYAPKSLHNLILCGNVAMTRLVMRNARNIVCKRKNRIVLARAHAFSGISSLKLAISRGVTSTNMQLESFRHLAHLHLDFCEFASQNPQLPTSIRKLQIRLCSFGAPSRLDFSHLDSLDDLDVIGCTFASGCIPLLPVTALKRLYIRGNRSGSTWSEVDEVDYIKIDLNEINQLGGLDDLRLELSTLVGALSTRLLQSLQKITWRMNYDGDTHYDRRQEIYGRMVISSQIFAQLDSLVEFDCTYGIRTPELELWSVIMPRNLTKLSLTDVSNGQGPNLRHLTSLKELVVVGFCTMSISSYPASLRKLSIRDQHQGLQDDALDFSHLAALEEVLISDCKCLFAPKSFAPSLKKITFRNLTFAGGMVEFSHLTLLEHLHLDLLGDSHYCSLRSVAPSLPPSLKTLHIFNDKTLSPVQLYHLTRLEDLTLKECFFILSPSILLPASLQKLNLHNTAFEYQTRPVVLHHLTSLHTLCLDSCFDRGILVETSRLPSSLTCLILSGNKSLGAQTVSMAHLTRLETLKMDGCHLLPFPVGSLPPYVTNLKLCLNKQLARTILDFALLTSLKKLSMRSCGITALPILPPSVTALKLEGNDHISPPSGFFCPFSWNTTYLRNYQRDYDDRNLDLLPLKMQHYS